MESWDKDGLLPPDLLVRKGQDTAFIPLQDLRQESEHRSQPFRASAALDAPRSIKEFTIVQTLGEQDSKSVFLGRRIATGERFVVEVLAAADIFTRNKITVIRSKRTVILHETNSQFISKVHFAFYSQSKAKIYLVKEMFTQGDCGALIRSLGHIRREDTTRDYILQIAQGLEYLHRQGIIHRDLRPENILIDEAHRLKLADFGLVQKAFLSQNIGEEPGKALQPDHGTGKQFFRIVYYLSPEAILGLQDDDDSIDWWAFGIITYEFLYGFTPFEAADLGLVFHNILTANIDWGSNFAASGAARDFIQSFLDPNPTARYSCHRAEQVSRHRYFNNMH
ncbi:kinase-like domain-containing protein, partial [Mycena leptocephala]